MPSLDYPGATTTSDQISQIQKTLGINPLVYASSETPSQISGDYIYYTWRRIDDTGYLIKRRVLSTGLAAGEVTGTGPNPVDPTILVYL